VPANGEAAANADDGKPTRKSRRDDEEEEDNTLTLDEYLAKKKAEDSAVPKLEGGRKIGDADWKDAFPLVKDENDVVYFAGKVCTVTYVRHWTTDQDRTYPVGEVGPQTSRKEGRKDLNLD
jgi:hypothetical protein